MFNTIEEYLEALKDEMKDADSALLYLLIAFVTGVFYFTWQGQAGSKTKEKGETPSAFKENTPSS